MSHPFISVCIPAYKKPASLQRLLQSVATQTFKDFEIIIADDSPDDAVKETVDQFAEKFSIRYYKNSPAAGMPANWNTAISKADGAWIKIMHDDDWFASPGALQLFADAAANTSCNFIFSACNNIYTDTGKEVNEYLHGWRKELLEDNPINLFYLNVIGHPSTVMHRNDAGVLYDTQFKWVVDIDFYIRYLSKHPGFVYIPEMLVNIGTDENQVSNNCYKNPLVEIPEYFTLLAKFQPDLLLKHQYVFHCVWDQLKKFKISNINMIRDYGYSGALPNKIERIINFQKNIPHIILKQTPWSKALMKICFKKITAS